MDQMMKTDTKQNNDHQSEVATKTSTKVYVLDDYEQKIVDLWNAKYPASEIAKALGKTRNTIVGKVWRLRRHGVEFIHHPIKVSSGPKVVKPKAARASKPFSGIRFNKAPRFPKSDALPLKEAVEAKPLNIGFWNLKANSCRYVMNDGRPENFIFCGAPKERGSYCEAHASICYMVPNLREKRERNFSARFGRSKII